LVAALAAGSTQWVEAYYDDTHYSLTYYIARSCGYTPLQSLRIASADVAVDSVKSQTEPVQGKEIFDPTERVQNARTAFHAMWDYRIDTARRDLARSANRGRERELIALANRQQNPGVLLHYRQDEEPHAGYQSWGGHWFPSSIVEYQTAALPWGPTTDYLSFSQSHAAKMVDSTIDTLRGFMRINSPRQRPGGVTCNLAAMLPVLTALVRVNPRPLQAEQQYKLKIAEILTEVGSGVLNTTQEQFRALLQRAGKRLPELTAGPQVQLADREIARALSEREIEPYKSYADREQYFYNAAGVNPVSDLPPFAIYGTLTANVRGAEGRKVGISIWAAPTRVGEKAYQVSECQDSGYKFDKMPVGNLIVQSSVDGKVTRRNFRLERSQQIVPIDIAPAKKDEPANKCQQEAAEIAAQACGGQKDANGDFTSNPNEDRLEKKLDECKEEEEKRKTEEQNNPPSQQQPPQPLTSGSGPSIGKILGWTTLLGGAAIGGVYVAQQAAALEDYSTPTGTSVGTTTGTTTTGGSTANYRYANWNCSGPQCASLFGGNFRGSAGPFCTVAACNAYQQSQFPSGVCTTSPQNPIPAGYAPSGGRACQDQ
jgi:hypothetical protein